MELIFLVIAIWVIASLLKGNSYPKWMSASLKSTVKKMEKDVKKAKKMEKEALKKGHTNRAAEIRAFYRETEKCIYDIKHPTRSVQDMRMDDLERRVEEAERKAREAEWNSWHR